MGTNVFAVVEHYTPIPEGEDEEIVFQVVDDAVPPMPGFRTEMVGVFNIQTIHVIGHVFSTTVILLAGVIQHNNEPRIVLCTIDGDMFKQAGGKPDADVIREHGNWWLAQKMGSLTSS